jgi:hypothetical protein
MTFAAATPALAVNGEPAQTPSASAEALSVEESAVQLYDAEVNLHYARQSCVDVWILAAYDHLHRAVQAHADACRRRQATPDR